MFNSVVIVFFVSILEGVVADLWSSIHTEEVVGREREREER